MPVYDEVRIATWSHSIPLYSRISCTAMPIGAPPRQTATRKVGRKPLRTTCKPSSIESRSSEFAEMKIFSMGSDDILTLRAGSLGTHLAPSKIPQQMQREFRRLAVLPVRCLSELAAEGQIIAARRHPGKEVVAIERIIVLEIVPIGQVVDRQLERVFL